MIEFLNALKKHGVTALFVAALYWMHDRLEKVEQDNKEIQAKLYDCLQDAAEFNRRPVTSRAKCIKARIMYALKPKEQRDVKELLQSNA